VRVRALLARRVIFQPMAAPTTRAAAVAFLLAAVAACAGSSQAGEQSSPKPVSRYPHTPADVRFMSAMIGHHAQALAMAALAPRNGASTEVRRLAERISAGQKDEIGTMQRWLRHRGEPVPEAHHAMHGHLMPGMLTEAQMEELARAKGPEFDRLFLTYMIQHHRGAVLMVKQLYGTPGAAQDDTVFKFANDVGVDQTTEIARMERMLDALPAGAPAS
jgi:uncharacterized protein (DUF305 family)